QLLDPIRACDARFHALVLLAATTGARRAQLLGLTWDQVHHDHKRVAFARGRVQGPTGSTVAPTKSRRRHSVEASKPCPVATLTQPKRSSRPQPVGHPSTALPPAGIAPTVRRPDGGSASTCAAGDASSVAGCPRALRRRHWIAWSAR